MLEVPISLVNLHDALVKAPSEQHKALILHDFKTSRWQNNQYLALKTQGRPLSVIHKPKGDGLVRCYWCGKKLDNSLSRIRGVGPICIETHGCMPGREQIESGLAQIYLDYRATCKKPLGIRKWLETLSDSEFKKYWNKYINQ
jgi:hypothetical protein